MRFLSVAALAVVPALQPQKGPVGLRELGFERARATAAIEKRPLLVLFCGADPACAKLAETTLRERKLRAWIDEKVVAIRLDPAAEPDLVNRYHVRTTPTFLFVDARGVEIDRILGFRDSAAVRAEGDEILAGGDALARLRARCAARPDDLDLKLRLADALASRGEMNEAVTGYLACYDAGGTHREAAFAALRWLGRAHPQPLDALVTLAARLEPAILAGTAGEPAVEEWLRLCGACGGETRVLGVYDALAAPEEPVDGAPALRRRLAPRLRDLFYVDRRYADLAPLLGDPQAALAERKRKHDASREREPLDTAAHKRALRDLRESTARDYETLIGLRRYGEAALLADKLIQADTSIATYDSLVEHALRAEAPAEAKAVALRGRADPRLDPKARSGIGPQFPH